MRALLLVVALLSSSALAQRGGGRFDRVNSRCIGGRSDRGLPCIDYAFFEFAPASGAGMGAPCACAAVTGAKGEALTLTRGSVGFCTKTATGGLATTGIANGDLVSCTNDKPRVEYDGAGTLGLLVEGARTNSTLRSQEIDNATWGDDNVGAVAPTLVGANDTVAPDGTTTADSYSFPATTAGQYSARYQPAACPVSTDTLSVYVKGTSGPGAMDVCVNRTAGVSLLSLECSFSASSWTRCSVPGAVVSAGGTIFLGNMTAYNGGTARNASNVAIWGAQCEAGAYATSYIPTTSAAAARSADDARFVLTSPPTLGNFSIAANAWTPSTTPVMRVHGALLREPDDGVNFIDSYQAIGSFQAQFASTSGLTTFADGATSTQLRAASYFDGTNVGACINSSCTTAAKGLFSVANFTGSLAVRIGSYSAANGNIDGVASRVCFEPNLPTRCR